MGCRFSNFFGLKTGSFQCVAPELYSRIKEVLQINLTICLQFSSLIFCLLFSGEEEEDDDDIDDEDDQPTATKRQKVEDESAD